MKVTLIDTSVLCDLLEVPGMCDRAVEVQSAFRKRIEDGERFVVPITAVIETGNHIAQVKQGDRWRAAERLVNLITAALREDGPFVLHRVAWDDRFLLRLRDGDATEHTLLQLTGNGILGAGDVAILVERELLLSASAYRECRVWTHDRQLAAFAS